MRIILMLVTKSMMGMKMLGSPNISMIMYCEISAPQLPIQLVAMASGLLMIFWSSAPVNKWETSDRMMKEDTRHNTTPTMKRMFSLRVMSISSP